MNQSQQEYIIAIKMLLDAIHHSSNTDILSESISHKFSECITHAEEVLNDSTEQVEHELDSENLVHEAEVKQESGKTITILKGTSALTDTGQSSMFEDMPFENETRIEEGLDHKGEITTQETKSNVNRSDMPFKVAETIEDIEKDLKQDVEDGLLDQNTAEKVVSLVDNESKYYRFEDGVLYVLKPDEMNVEVTSKTFFANFLSQEYSQNLSEINVEQMNIDYNNHVFKSLTWTNKYGVRFSLVIRKYVEFLERYVLN